EGGAHLGVAGGVDLPLEGGHGFGIAVGADRELGGAWVPIRLDVGEDEAREDLVGRAHGAQLIDEPAATLGVVFELGVVGRVGGEKVFDGVGRLGNRR